jgi:RNA polymerase sigma-70 factor (ECF subfamily)
LLVVLSFTDAYQRDKFEYLFNKYKKLMLHKAYSVLGDYALAEDAASEAFIRIYKNLHKIDDPDSPQTAAYLVTVTRNAAITMLGFEKTHTAEPLEEYQSDGSDLEEDVLSRVSAQQIYVIIDSLKDELKAVFLLKFAYGHSHREIGGILGISENNVTVRLHRAKKALAQMLAKEGYVNG